MSGTDTTSIHRLDLMLFEEESPASSYRIEQQGFGHELKIPVYRKEVSLSAWGNLYNSYLDHTNRLVQTMQPCDSIWLFRQTIRTDCRDAYVRISPESQTRTVDVLLRGNISGISDVHASITGIDKSFTFKGDIPAGHPGENVLDLVKYPEPGREYYQFRSVITRQYDPFRAELHLEFTSGGVVRNCAYDIGSMLHEAGEDLTKSGGHPIVIDMYVGGASVLVSVKVEEWICHDVFEITL